MASLPMGDQPATWGPWLPWTHFFIEEADSLPRNMHASEYGFAFRGLNTALEPHPHLYTYRMLYLPWYSVHFCFSWKNSFHSKGNRIIGLFPLNQIVLPHPITWSSWPDWKLEWRFSCGASWETTSQNNGTLSYKEGFTLWISDTSVLFCLP